MATVNKYAERTRAKQAGRPIGTFLFIIFLFVFTLVYNLPEIKVNQTIFGKKIDTIGAYNFNFPFLKRDLSLRRGLDLQGGVQLTLQANMKDIKEADRKQALDSATDIISRRVNAYGVSEPVVQSSRSGNDYRIIVELPGVTDVNEALSLVGRTARLEFREPMNASQTASLRKKLFPDEATKSATASAEKSPADLLAGMDASESAQLKDYIVEQQAYNPTALTGKELKLASVTFSQRTGVPEVSLEFKDQGTKLFSEMTTKYVGQKIAIYLDDQVVSAPVVNTPITDGHAIISGNFTVPQAQQLVTQLNAGALPVPINVLEQRNIGATLGNQSVQKSITAGVIGIAIVALFMLALYGFQGLLADIALILYALITLFVFRFVPVTLTLAGIAGFILSIGMALDANILIFERMREEIRWGRSRRDALRLGFDRAWSSIRDSNISSLITCAILYGFGTGIVKGFALTLALGIAVSLFTAITVTRTLLRMVYK
jgi:preprotein translocase subunit SecD